MVASADPPPAAWVRLAALAGREPDVGILAALLDILRPHLRAQGAHILGWLISPEWQSAWLDELGFEPVNWLTTYVKRDERLPAFEAPRMVIRPAQAADLAELARLEAGAFDPLWRHSEGGLAGALNHARTFDVAERDGQLVAFQYSVEGFDATSIHLVRITVRREAQGQGVGSALLAHALQTDWRMGYERVTLNTQLDNHNSRRLYRKFGFREIGEEVPVWGLPL
jgi:ribosomal protein S18 acetylase RimI-like enzyme